MIAVGIGRKIEVDFLRDMASYPIDSNYFFTETIGGVDDILADVRDSICNGESACHNNYHVLETKVSHVPL